MSKEIELKPCPSCGGDAEMVGDLFPYVECNECSLSFNKNHQYDSDFESAAEQWNYRVSPEEDELNLEVASLREALRLKEAECESIALDKQSLMIDLSLCIEELKAWASEYDDSDSNLLIEKVEESLTELGGGDEQQAD